MFSSVQPVLEHLATCQAIPRSLLKELLPGPWSEPTDNPQALLDRRLIQPAKGKSNAYILSRKGRQLLGQKRLDYEPSPNSVSLAILKQRVITLLSYGNWQLDESDRSLKKGDLAFSIPNGGRAFVRCTFKDMSVGELAQMLARYLDDEKFKDRVVITARCPESYRTYLEKEFIFKVKIVNPSIYDLLDA